MAIAQGTQVTQVIAAPIEGTVVGYQVDGQTGEVLNLVKYEQEGVEHFGYFSDKQLAIKG
jgi:hypothetical protein